MRESGEQSPQPPDEATLDARWQEYETQGYFDASSVGTLTELKEKLGSKRFSAVHIESPELEILTGLRLEDDGSSRTYGFRTKKGIVPIIMPGSGETAFFPGWLLKPG